MTKEGIREFDCCRTVDSTKPTTRIKRTPAQLPHSWGTCSKVNSTAVAGTARDGPRTSSRTRKRNPRKIISSTMGATPTPNNTNMYRAPDDVINFSIGVGLDGGKSDETTSTLMARAAPIEIKKRVRKRSVALHLIVSRNDKP